MGATLNIASYNVHSCVGVDMRCDVARVAKVIRELDCDTVGVQEVIGRHGEKRCDPNQLEELAGYTSMTALGGATILRDDGHYGNAILTRRPIVRSCTHDLSFRHYEPRGAIEADLDVDGKVVRIFVTHLGLRPAERRAQVRQIADVLGRTPLDMPLVVLGDINEWLPIGRPVRWLHRLLEQAPSARSFPVWMPVFALDRIWVRPRRMLRTFAVHRSPTARVASDHYPVKARIAVGD
jgi:endonuclease/exonuclease/phosphatase family metal-dependent hydrolase